MGVDTSTSLYQHVTSFKRCHNIIFESKN